MMPIDDMASLTESPSTAQRLRDPGAASPSQTLAECFGLVDCSSILAESRLETNTSLPSAFSLISSLAETMSAINTYTRAHVVDQ